MSSEAIAAYRSVLAKAIEEGGDTTPAVKDLMLVNVPLKEKFYVVEFCNILQSNSESPSSLKKFINALNILEKYGKHLLKPAENRSNMWRHIKYSNPIFRERVSTVVGGLSMMQLMGYTDNRPDGVAFPDGAEPNHAQILNLVTDIVLGRKELEIFLEKGHRYPENIEIYLAPQLRISLNGENVENRENTQQAYVPSSKSAFVHYQQSPSLPAGPLTAFSGQVPSQSGTNHMYPYMQPGMNQMPYSMQPTNQMAAHMQSSANQTLPYSHSEGNLQRHTVKGFPQQPNQMLSHGGQYEGASLMARPKSDLYLDHRGQPAGMMHEYETENSHQNMVPNLVPSHRGQYLQQGDSHMARPQHAEQGQISYQVQQQQQQQQEQQLLLDVEKAQESQAHDLDTTTPSIACDICGENHAVAICKMCDNKQLCKDCDIKWHNHPKRQNHTLERIRPLSDLRQPGSETTQNYDRGGEVYYPDLSPQRAHMGYAVPQNTPNYQMNVKHGQTAQNSGHSGRNITPGSPGEQLISGYGYSRPSLMPRMQGGMHYPVSSGGMQGRQPLGYPSMVEGPVPPYQMGYYPPVFMQQQQPMHAAYFTGSSAASQIPDNTFITPVGTRTVEQRSPSTLPRSSNTQASSTNPEVVQNIPYSIPSTRVAQPPDISSLGSNISTGPASELLPGIRMISDLDKRLSRLDISLMNLNDDLKEWEDKINVIILHNPNFFQDEDYKNLSRKKRKHLQEKSELEKYKQELEKIVAGKHEREALEREEIERKAREVETLRKRFDQIRTSHEHLSGSPVENYLLPSNVEKTKQTGSTSDGLVPAGPVTVTYRPNQVVNQSDILGNLATAAENCPDLNPSSLGEDPPDEVNVQEIIATMLGLGEPKVQIQPGKLNKDIIGTNLAAAPVVTDQHKYENQLNENKVLVKKTISETNKMQLRDAEQTLVQQANSGRLATWECEHCTFQNPGSSKACEMCFRTSKNPKRIEPDKPYKPSLTEELIKGRSPGEPCEFCTVHNPPGTKVCQVCGKTQSRYESQRPIQENDGRPSIQKKVGEDNNSDAAQVAGGAAAGASAGSGVRKMIEEEQDQVFLEKKAAKERFERMNRAAEAGLPEETLPAGAQGQKTMENIPRLGTSDTAKYSMMESSGAEDELPRIDHNETTPAKGNKTLKEEKGISPANRDVEKLSKMSSGSSGSYSSAPGSFSETPQELENKVMVMEGATKHPKAPQLNFVEAIEQINLKREQEQMSLDGHEIMTILKEAERAGYEIPEIEIAIQHCIEEKLRPLEWLKNKWVVMVDTVAATATENGKMSEQNDIGDVSNQEAKSALLECNGEIDKAIETCVKERQAKYAAISECGQYPREDVLTALYQNCGDIDEAIDQLNNSVLQPFAERIWERNENGGGDVAIAAAARSRELTNSVCNSVINSDDFNKLVTDTNIDKERRVRMVFIEAKLKSWGRAETVIKLLDEDIANSEEKLECNLEDVIEAVRNCGDRRSSLVYLRQECGCCFALYPMSKIQKLGVCDCNMCLSCLKQHFEVSIKEKHVRNWVCPLCEAPDTEDETKAGPHFEFLQLILQNLLSRELLDLYATKLRDWHLQKSENFRWCAHCQCGFIWDRRDILGMTCPNCHKKTCFMCKIMWEDQHEGLTCEQFEQWKIDNDPEKQAKGVKLYLEENGIDCPSCKMRYSLAKGGCMHFKCPQCGFEFCSGCSQAFIHQGACELLKSCKNKGLHCHHPRDCFYYLRDNNTEDLQRLLKNSKVVYNTEIPATQEDKKHCPVMEQKEDGVLKKDEACGKDIAKGMAGLCEGHYKEYLVGLINRNKIDPVFIMSLKDMKILIERNEKEVPALGLNENENAYRKRIMQFIKERWQLHR